MRGIDADTLKACYTGHNGMDDKATYESIRKMIDIQPTVFDFSNVASEIEQLKEEYSDPWQEYDAWYLIDRVVEIFMSKIKKAD